MILEYNIEKIQSEYEKGNISLNELREKKILTKIKEKYIKDINNMNNILEQKKKNIRENINKIKSTK